MIGNTRVGYCERLLGIFYAFLSEYEGWSLPGLILGLRGVLPVYDQFWKPVYSPVRLGRQVERCLERGGHVSERLLAIKDLFEECKPKARTEWDDLTAPIYYQIELRDAFLDLALEAKRLSDEARERFASKMSRLVYCWDFRLEVGQMPSVSFYDQIRSEAEIYVDHVVRGSIRFDRLYFQFNGLHMVCEAIFRLGGHAFG